MKVLVVGMGKVGLPIASYLAEGYNWEVYGYDANSDLIESLKGGHNPLPWEPDIVANKIKFIASLAEAPKELDAAYIIVPTPTLPG